MIRNDEKQARAAHKFMTQILWKDKSLSFRDAIDIPCIVLKMAILSNAENPNDMREMIAFARERVEAWLATLDVENHDASRIHANKGERQ